MTVKQTAGREAWGEFAPKFAELNDDVLFGQVWSREDKRDGKVSCHYCDSFCFQQVPGFLPDNPLKNAEMMLEDDYGIIDGIINNGPKEPTVAQLEQQARSGQPISFMNLAAAAHREDRKKKKSVMEQLKSQPKAEHKKAVPKKSAEREL